MAMVVARAQMVLEGRGLSDHRILVRVLDKDGNLVREVSAEAEPTIHGDLAWTVPESLSDLPVGTYTLEPMGVSLTIKSRKEVDDDGRAARGDSHDDHDDRVRQDEHGHDGRTPAEPARPGPAAGERPAVLDESAADVVGAADQAPGGKVAPPARRLTTAYALTSDPSGPALAVTGPMRDGTYTIELTDSRVTQCEPDRLSAALLYLAIRIDTGGDA